MKFNISQMNYEEAREISKWKYEESYSIYNMEESDGCINELINGNYFSVRDVENNLIGYYCFGESAQVPAGREFGVYDDIEFADIGLGMAPNLCGKGLGVEFFNSGLAFMSDKLKLKSFRLTVADFNHRAIRVYEKIGFEKVNFFKRVSNLEEVEFIIMVLS